MIKRFLKQKKSPITTQLVFQEQDIDLTVIWTKSPNRRTMALQVSHEGIVCKTPMNVDVGVVKKWLEEKKAWLLKQQIVMAPDILPNQWRLSGTCWVFGTQRSIEQGHLKKQQLIDQQQVVYVDANRDIQKQIHKQLKTLALFYLTERLATLAPLLSVQPKGIRFKQTKRQWGHCTAKGNIQLNWQIVMAPKPVIDYLLIHELCHLIHFNHSPEFWAQVESIQPDYKIHKAWLNKNGSQLQH